MSGHSKWSTIKRKKAAADAKRGAAFSRIIKEITVAVRLNGRNPETNPRLRLAIIQARSANMPQANIERAIKKGAGELEGVRYESAMYEGYGPGGAAILMDVLTDNKNRTVADIRHLMTKYGGNLGESGSVAWQFENRGTITLHMGNISEDALFETAVDYGAEELELEEDRYVISVPAEKIYELADVLRSKGYKVESVEIGLEPNSSVVIIGQDARCLMQLLDALDELEDIQKVYSNCDIPVDELAAISA